MADSSPGQRDGIIREPADDDGQEPIVDGRANGGGKPKVSQAPPPPPASQPKPGLVKGLVTRLGLDVPTVTAMFK